MVDQRTTVSNKGQKSKFSKTCSLLSQYMKEMGSLRGLALHMAPLLDKSLAPTTTMNLLPGVVGASREDQTENHQKREPPKSTDLFRHNYGFDSEIKLMLKGQLTIFYGGKVLVFDDYPQDKAKNLMHMASKESNIAAQHFCFSAADCHPKLDSTSLPVSSPAPVAATPQVSLSKAIESDMPIARSNSLHRFLEKRKYRICTKAPYQVRGSPAPAIEAEPESSESRLNLGTQDEATSASIAGIN
ncbi:protein TIFY 10b-like [Curcuma longa]|uniref:protein TIFY 10b-like n=1 Tax=Curcuma longa TaxID=136217 RepID=UPI003D9EAC37